MVTHEALEDLLDRLPVASDVDEWCERLESIWNGRQQINASKGEFKREEEGDDASTAEKSLQQVSAQLRFLLFKSLGGITSEREQEDPDSVLQSSEDILKTLLSNLRSSSSSTGDHPSNHATIQTQLLRVILRASKNFLRWYLQVYQTRSIHLSSAAVSKDHIAEWKNMGMLRLYHFLLQKFSTSDPDLAQNVAQVLFYASYNPISGSDASLQDAYDCLLEQDSLASTLLDLLIHSTTTGLTLSLVRNVHNILVTFPKGLEYVTKAVQSFDRHDNTQSTLAPWTQHSTFRDSSTTMTFDIALPLVALWALEIEPPFPGQDGDKRAELVVEIQRACYVLRTGSSMEPQGPIAEMVLTLLRLDPTEQRCEDCRRASVPLLMDSKSEEVASFLMSKSAVTPLLNILDAQVTEVLEKQLVDDSAAALLTPVLVVLHKFCSANDEVKSFTKTFIFPPEMEDDFQLKARHNIQVYGKPRNMTPLDAPRGTLRWKMVQLMTWPQGHVKRFTTELLWVICEGDSHEFIARVGMGNAAIFLSSKGYQLPFQIPGE